MRERIRRGLESAKKHKPYIQDMIMDLFSLGPEDLLMKSPDVYNALREGRLSREDIYEVVEKYQPLWEKAKSIDLYDAGISAAQAVATIRTGGASYPLGKLAEIVEMIPKMKYFYRYAIEAGLWPTAILGLYELLTVVDPTELMDIAPAYMISTLYLMHRKVKKKIKPKERRRVVGEVVPSPAPA